ncbi:hypothetical protein [Streptomyces sp. NPDC058086]
MRLLFDINDEANDTYVTHRDSEPKVPVGDVARAFEATVGLSGE